jgi:Tfp pilus assembly protein PilV
MTIPISKPLNAAASRRHWNIEAFTLLEVMVAVAVFFMALFAILGLVSQNIKAAHSLQQHGPTAGMLAAELSITNQLEVGTESGDFGEFYPDYTWDREVNEFASNGLFQVDFLVYKNGNEDSRLTVLMYKPGTGLAPTGVQRIFGTRPR